MDDYEAEGEPEQEVEYGRAVKPAWGMKVLLVPISVHELWLVQGPDPAMVQVVEVQLEHASGPASATDLDSLCFGTWS